MTSPVTPEPAPTMGDTSRDLLWTTLGEFVLPHDKAVWTQTLVAVMDRLDVRDKATRQAVARLHDRGWLQRSRVGRRTRWSLDPSAEALLTEGAARIYGFGHDEHGWDGRWLLVLASVPERNRGLRYRMGVGLRWAGFGSLGNGLWVSPWTEREAAVVELTESLGVEATIFIGELGALGTPAGCADEAWDLSDLAGQYRAFLREVETIEPASLPAEDAAAELVTLVHRWRRFPLLDPDLPPELLPPDWPGPDAVKRFAELRQALLPAATEWWLAAEARYAAT